MNDTRDTAGTYWKIGIATVVCLFIVATVASVVIAKRKGSRVVDTEYYRHGLHYAENHSKGGNSGTGWAITASVAGNSLQIVVRDDAGTPVTGGQALYDIDRGAGSRTGGAIPMVEVGEGVYRMPRPESDRGELRGTVRFTKGDGTVISKVDVVN